MAQTHSRKTRTGSRILVGLLALPALAIVGRLLLLEWSEDSFADSMHSSGEMAVRLLIVSLLATPLMRIWPRSRVPRWLRRNRRTLGVASFGYSLLHLGIYVTDRRGQGIIDDLALTTYVAGWAAFLLMVPLAATSFDRAQRRLRKQWFILHRLAYVVAVCSAVHWILKPEGRTLGPVLVHFLPLVLFEANRVRLFLKAGTR